MDQTLVTLALFISERTDDVFPKLRFTVYGFPFSELINVDVQHET